MRAHAPHAPHADTFHKPGFKLHAAILHLLFQILDMPNIQGPLWDVAAKGPAVGHFGGLCMGAFCMSAFCMGAWRFSQTHEQEGLPGAMQVEPDLAPF